MHAALVSTVVQGAVSQLFAEIFLRLLILKLLNLHSLPSLTSVFCRARKLIGMPCPVESARSRQVESERHTPASLNQISIEARPGRDCAAWRPEAGTTTMGY